MTESWDQVIWKVPVDRVLERQREVDDAVAALARYPTEILGELDRQRLYVLRVQNESRACPVCRFPLTKWIGEVAYDAIHGRGTKFGAGLRPDTEHACPRCGVGMQFVLPFIGPWYWQPDLSPSDLVRPGQ